MSAPPGRLLRVCDLTVHFGATRALGPVSLDIPLRGITGVLGDPGSGKTTLLRALNRLHALEPRARVTGQVLLDGLDLFAGPLAAAEVRRRMGMVFPTATALPMSVRGNIAFALRLHGRQRPSARERVILHVLHRVGLWPAPNRLLDAPAGSLSLLDQQRLAIARALAIDCEVLLLDDPARHLDAAATQALEELLDRLKAEVPMLLTTRQAGQAARCSDALVLLQNGLAVATGSAAQVLDAPASRTLLGMQLR